jgi:hypothetical protein
MRCERRSLNSTNPNEVRLWSGHAPALPVIEAGQGAPDPGPQLP